MLMEWADALLSKMLECMELMGEGMDTPLTVMIYRAHAGLINPKTM